MAIKIMLSGCNGTFQQSVLGFLDAVLISRAQIPKVIKNSIIKRNDLDPKDFYQIVLERCAESSANGWTNGFSFDRLNGSLTEICWTCRMPYHAISSPGDEPTRIFLQLVGGSWRIRVEARD